MQSKWGFDQQTGKRFYLFRLQGGRAAQGRRRPSCGARASAARSRAVASQAAQGRDHAVQGDQGVRRCVKKKSRRFRAGQTLQLRITAPGFTGKVVKYKLKRRKQPVGKVLCLPEGAKKPRKC